MSEATHGRRSTRPAVLLLHGQPGTGADWSAVLREIPEDIRVLAPDRPGYGTSTYAACGLVENARILVGLLDAGSIDRTVVVGFSHAGGIALALAQDWPERVESVLLVSSVGGCVTAFDRSRAGLLGALPELLTAALPRRLRSSFVEERACIDELPTVLERNHLVSAPVVAIAAEDDGIIPVECSRTLCARIPNSRLIELPTGGHALHRTHPQVLASQIAQLAAAR